MYKVTYRANYNDENQVETYNHFDQAFAVHCMAMEDIDNNEGGYTELYHDDVLISSYGYEGSFFAE